MKTNLLLDVAELSLSQLTENSSVIFINIHELYKKFQEGTTLCKSKASFEDFRKALQAIFPIYKNKRKHTTLIKISSKTAYNICESKSLKLRPLLHIKRENNIGHV